ncbi:DMT family transporter [Paenibacillus daejeonensis]|uniref:DMT family transporter n=1 Tax=Paenibacillus daejeonensis TaxID=135193 RepID=UPI000368D770|nr:DMT family transporter [Paenibacillus daejeonensis]
MDRKWLYISGLIAVAAIWGANFGLSRFAMDAFDPILFTFLRFCSAVPFFFILLKLREGSVGIPWRVGLALAAIGLFGIALLEIMVMYSIKYTSLANASLLNVAPWPIFAALLAPLFTKEVITARLLVGGGAAMVGVCFVILGGGDSFSLAGDQMLGNALALGVSLLGALFNLACMPFMRRYSALRVSSWMILFGSLFMLPLTWGSWGQVQWGALTATHYSILLYNILFCTVIGFVVWNACMYQVGAARANFFRYVVPAAAVVAGYLMFGEQLTWLQLAGAACMAGGLVWISVERKQAAPLPSQTSVQQGAAPIK